MLLRRLQWLHSSLDEEEQARGGAAVGVVVWVDAATSLEVVVAAAAGEAG